MERAATPVAETYQNDSVTTVGHAPPPSLLGRALVARVMSEFVPRDPILDLAVNRSVQLGEHGQRVQNASTKLAGSVKEICFLSVTCE
jgi:hypothetical protein